MNILYKCPLCKAEVSLEKRMHKCNDRFPVIYEPRFPKSNNKQSSIPGYMKRFGSRAVKA